MYDKNSCKMSSDKAKHKRSTYTKYLYLEIVVSLLHEFCICTNHFIINTLSAFSSEHSLRLLLHRCVGVASLSHIRFGELKLNRAFYFRYVNAFLFYSWHCPRSIVFVYFFISIIIIVTIIGKYWDCCILRNCICCLNITIECNKLTWQPFCWFSRLYLW